MNFYSLLVHFILLKNPVGQDGNEPNMGNDFTFVFLGNGSLPRAEAGSGTWAAFCLHHIQIVSYVLTTLFDGFLEE